MPIKLTDTNKQNTLQYWIALLAIIAMSAGFFWSRALLSIGMIVMFFNTFISSDLKQIFYRFRTNWYCVLSVIYFLIYLLSGFWSENIESWKEVMILKLPFLIFPFSIWSIPFQNQKFRHYYLTFNVVLLSIVILISLVYSWANWDQYVASYSHSKLIPTFTKVDHIRLGIFMALNVLLLFHAILKDNLSKIFKYTFVLGIVLIIIYLHILSAKSGLIALYIVLLGVAVYIISQKLHIIKAITISLAAIMVVLILAYKTVPTFGKKVDYVLLEVKMVQSGEPLDYNYSDLGRLVSYQMAIQEIKKMPVYGVGAGDWEDVMKQAYNIKYPDIPQKNRIEPHNQYLLEILVLGWLFVTVFIAMTIAPFFYNKNANRLFTIINTLVFLFALNVEAMLEVQYGVYVYLFFTMIWFVMIPRVDKEKYEIPNMNPENSGLNSKF